MNSQLRLPFFSPPSRLPYSIYPKLVDWPGRCDVCGERIVCDEVGGLCECRCDSCKISVSNKSVIVSLNLFHCAAKLMLKGVKNGYSKP